MSTTTDRATGRAVGEEHKLNAHAVLTARRGLYVLRGRRALLITLLASGEATVDDIHDGIDLPDGIDPVCIGAIPGLLVRAGLIRRVGHVPTSRPDAHARPVSVWALADRAAVERWLVAHPDPNPEPASTDPADGGAAGQESAAAPGQAGADSTAPPASGTQRLLFGGEGPCNANASA